MVSALVRVAVEPGGSTAAGREGTRPSAGAVREAELTFLSEFLRPLAPWLSAPDISEIAVNRPGEVWIERHALGSVGAGPTDECVADVAQGWELYAVPGLDARAIAQLARQIAAHGAQAVSRQMPLLSATLPSGERIQVVLPPASEAGVLCIRKPVLRDMDLGTFLSEAAGDVRACGGAVATGTPREQAARGGAEGEPRGVDTRLRELVEHGEMAEFLRVAVRARKNVLLSGGTSSGKTTLLNALAKEIPRGERIVTIEDTREVRLPHENRVSLVASRGDQGEARVTVQDLLEASLRLRPDRILLGELRGAEAYTYLRAVNTGHPGSISTLHADSPARALDQLALMVLQANLGLSRAEIIEYVRSVVDVIVQVERRPSGGRVVSAVEFLRG